MNNVQILRNYITQIEKTLNLLSSPNYVQANNLEGLANEFRVLRRKFSELSTLTGQGRATPELRTEKLKALKKWLVQYTGSHGQTLEQALPKKYRNKDVLIDSSTLDQYQRYAALALQYMSNLTARYRETKSKADSIALVGRMLEKHLDNFILGSEDLPAPDLLSDDDSPKTLRSPGLENLAPLEEELDFSQAPTVAPLKMIKTIGAILKVYGRFITKVENKYQELLPLIEKLELVDLDDLFPKLNQKNHLIQSLFRNLVSVNKILYQEKFHYGPAFREQYYHLVRECLPYLPENLAHQVKFMVSRLTGTSRSPAEEALHNSVKKVKERDPLSDPEMFRQSPHVLPPKLTLDKKIILSPDSEKLPENKEESLAQTFKKEQLSPEDQKKYESLWETASQFQLSALTKVAQNFRSKSQSK